MGIDSTYFYGGAAMLATLYLFSHWQNFDGGFHRPGNKFKKQKRKAERDASARGSQLEADEERERERRRSETPGPRPSRAELRRGRTRDQISDSRYGAGRDRRGNDRYDDSSSDESEHDNYVTATPREKRHDAGHRTKIQQVPNGAYVYEEEILDEHPSKDPLRPVNARHARTSERKPADFAMEDPTKPGHRSLRETRYEAYSQLYGARDTGHDFIDTE